MQNAVPAASPCFLKRLTDPLTDLLGVSILAREDINVPCWPDPGYEAHLVLHREFAERGTCPLLPRPLDEAFVPLDGRQPTAACPLGLTVRRFAIRSGEGRQGDMVMGPYFTRAADRDALFGRSKAADAALALLPYLSPSRHTALVTLCEELTAFAGTAFQAGSAEQTFLANMSHELRTPLNGVMGMLSLVLQDELPPRQRQFLSLAMDASRQLLRQVNELLELADLSACRLSLTEAPFDLRRELEPVFTAGGEEATRRGLDFAVHVDADVPERVVGDAARLKQVLRNFLTNAFQFTERGSVGIEIARLADVPRTDASTLLFSVRDTGVGVPPERQRRVFERFALGEDFLRKRYGSLGIGLAISREIVEKMGGSVMIDSTPGQGSEFSFTIVVRHVGGAPIPETAPSAGPGHVILLAVEDPVTRHLVRRILEDQGQVPVLLEEGRIDRETLGYAPAMLVAESEFAGRSMPHLLERIRAGREPGVAPDLPIVLLRPAGDVGAAVEGDADAVVSKPVTRRALLAVVERVLREWPVVAPLKFHVL